MIDKELKKDGMDSILAQKQLKIMLKSYKELKLFSGMGHRVFLK
jgi:hypothetical protein